ncbi:MAG: ATP-binding protein [Pseudomonadota bacterium]
MAIAVPVTWARAAMAQDAGTATSAPGGTAFWIAAVAITVAAAALAVAWMYRRSRQSQVDAEHFRKETGRLEAFLAAAPSPFCAFSQGGASGASRGFRELIGAERVNGISDICARLPEQEAEQLEAAFARLRQAGEPFDLRVNPSSQTTVRLLGRRGGSADQSETQFDLIWAEDVSQITQDQSKNKRQLDGMKRQFEELRSVLDNLPMPIWYRGEGDRVTFANSAYARALEQPVEAVLENATELGAAVIAQGGTALASRARATGKSQSESHHMVIAGDRRQMTFVEQPTEAGAIIGFAKDDTPLDEAHNDLQRHIRAHAEVLERIPSAIVIFGSDRKVVFFNQAYVEMFDFDERWLASNPTMNDLLEDLRARRLLPEFANFPDFKREQDELFTSLIEPAEQFRHLPDGRTLRMTGTAHPFGGILMVFEDVTSVLDMERSFRLQMEVQRESLDNLAEGIAVFASDGRLRLSNPAYAKIWNLTADDLKALPHVAEIIDRTRDFYPDGQELDDDEWQARRDEMAAKALDRESIDEVIERSDGSVIKHISVPLPDGNVLQSYLDISDTARVEQALRESNEALETADRLKSEFIANVSYQLRTPLNAITGFAEILDNEYFGELNERQKEYTANIVDASQRLLALINDILDLATIEAGYMTLEPKPLDAREVLESVYLLANDWASKQNLSVNIDAPAQVGTIIGDDRRLRQALYNLVSNSIKFTPPSGSITLSGRRDGDTVRLAVGDTGVGIPENEQPRVFGKFEKGQDGVRNRGVGLGLALVKSLIELHGGEIILESEVGKGTTVTCVLPIAKDSGRDDAMVTSLEAVRRAKSEQPEEQPSETERVDGVSQHNVRWIVPPKQIRH